MVRLEVHLLKQFLWVPWVAKSVIRTFSVGRWCCAWCLHKWWCTWILFLFPVFSGSATEHTATIIDGKAIARQVQQEIAVKVSKMKESVGKAPGLAVILVGTRKDSETYVQIKKKACEEVGFDFFGVKLPDNTTQDEILKFVKKFNDNPAVHGTQVQLPLPKVCTLFSL